MFKRALQSEFFKLVGKRSSLSFVIGMFLFVPLLAASFVMLAQGTQPVVSGLTASALDNPTDLLLLVFRSGSMFPLLLGLYALTTEYGSRTVLRTYQVFTKRLYPLLGKALILLLITIIASLLSALMGIVILSLSGIESFEIARPVELVSYFVIFNSIIVLFSYSMGMLLSKTIPSLLAVFAVIYLLPDVLRTVFRGFYPTLIALPSYLPGDAARTGVDSAILGSAYEGIPILGGIAAAALTTITLFVFGLIVQSRKDVA